MFPGGSACQKGNLMRGQQNQQNSGQQYGNDQPRGAFGQQPMYQGQGIYNYQSNTQQGQQYAAGGQYQQGQLYTSGRQQRMQAQQGYSSQQYPAGQQGYSGQTYQGQQYQAAQQGYSGQTYQGQQYQAAQQGYSGQQYPAGQQAFSGQQYPVGQQGYSGQRYQAGQQSFSGQQYPVGQQQGYSGQQYPVGQQQGYSGQPYPQPRQGMYQGGQYGGNGYPQAGYQQQAGNQAGSYIPQTPYNQNAYGNQGGYGYAAGRQAQGGYQNGAAPAQQQMNLNGAGYVPPPAKVKRQPFVLKDVYLILVSVLLLILFGMGIYAGTAQAPALRAAGWIFTGLAAACIALLWIKKMTANNKRLCFTIVFGVLAAISVFSLLNGSGTPAQTPDTSTQTVARTSTETSSSKTITSGGGVVVDGQSGMPIESVAASTATSTPKPDNDDVLLERLMTFFQYWAANQTEEMLTLCSPSWQSSVESPKTALFGLMANRTPMEYSQPENITGTNDDTSREVTITVTMDRNNGKDPVKYRMTIMMVKESQQWYIDPQSLKSYEAAETTDPASAATPEPTETPGTASNTILYYNPDGGTKYHSDPNCKSIHAKYLPLKGTFTYAQINDDTYKDLKPCNVCNAPLR